MNPEIVPTFSDLAAAVGLDRARIYDIRRMDPRFPQRTPAGWSVGLTSLFIRLRRIERMTADQFANEFGAELDRTRLAEIMTQTFPPKGGPPHAHD